MNKNDGTDLITDHFGQLAGAGGGDQFAEPADAVPSWLPAGYVQVTDPSHVLKESDCVLPVLSNDRRFVGDVNTGQRVGRLARDAGHDIQYIATLIQPT